MAIRVLLADDHVIVCQSLKAVLEREGFQVVGEAADGREAVRLARALRPDVAAALAHRGGPGLGLVGIRERLDALRGSLQITSAPGRSARVHVTIPLEV